LKIGGVMKLKPAGKLKNLNDFVVGAAVLISDGKVGYITDVSEIVTSGICGDVVECKADINYPNCGNSYHKYRRDGRSHYDAEHDIVSICRPEYSKIKSIRVWSDGPITKFMMDFGYDVADQYKLRIDTGEKRFKTRVIESEGYSAQARFTKTGVISVKVWK
jgi:hypothetical protein